MRILTLIPIILLFSGCFGEVDESLRRYKGINGTVISDGCMRYNEDICKLFDCMMENCECKKLRDDQAVLHHGDTSFSDEKGAEQALKSYLGSRGIDFETEKVVRINSIFFYVYVKDKEGTKRVYTIAADGSIILTQCYM